MTDVPPKAQPLELPKIDWKEASKAIETIKPLSERGWVIVAAAKLDERLEIVLKSFFANIPKAADKVFNETGPIGTFYARIEIAFLLGLISEREHRILHLIRKIRNDFSHKSDDLSFSESPIRERCEAFDTTLILGSPSGRNTHMDKFFSAFQFIFLALLYREEKIKHLELPQPLSDEELKSWFKALESVEANEAILKDVTPGGDGGKG